MPLKAAGPPPARRGWPLLAALVLLPMAAGAWPYATVLASDLLAAALCRQPAFPMGPGTSIRLATRFTLAWAAPAAAALLVPAGVPMEAALGAGAAGGSAGALVYGWFCVRLSVCRSPCSRWRLHRSPWAVCRQWDSLTAAAMASPAW